MNIFRTSLLAAALMLSLAPAAQAADLVRKVDSFDFLADYSGSMMMKNKAYGMTKAAYAKKVLTAVNNKIPELGYKASLHTFAPATSVHKFGDWNKASMNKAIAGLKDDLAVFGRMTPMGDGMAQNSGDYARMVDRKAVIIASDGENNRGIDPVAEAAAIYQATPNICFHVISFADSKEGQAVLDKIAALNSCSVKVLGADLMKDNAALEKFVEDVFYTAGKDEALRLHVNFAFNSYALDAKSTVILDEAAKIIKEKNTSAVLEGWTDCIGTQAYNLKLSQNRANSVKNYLVKAGINAKTLIPVGKGISHTYGDKTEEQRAMNRRVEINFK